MAGIFDFVDGELGLRMSYNTDKKCCKKEGKYFHKVFDVGLLVKGREILI